MTQSVISKVSPEALANLALTSLQLGPQLDDAIIQDSLDVAGFSSTFIGQDRAKAALSFAIGMDMPGYNLYVMGEPALGRFTLVQDILQSAASEKETPDDWCYLNNFDDERTPQTLRLLPGEGRMNCRSGNVSCQKTYERCAAIPLSRPSSHC